jgi:hypothetical protein
MIHLLVLTHVIVFEIEPPSPNMLGFLTAGAISEPSSYEEAMGILAWEKAMFEEHGALEHIGTLEVVPLNAHVVPIICKWVYKVKTKGDGSTKQYRAHFVA